jgi:hypothetical protein
MWQAADEKSPLVSLWLHRREKAADPRPDGSPWGVILVFADRGERYEGAPAKVEADSTGLKIVLAPPGKREKRGAGTLRISKAGERLKVRVIGGKFQGTYWLDKARAKH